MATFVVSGLATLVNPFGPDVYSSALGITFNQDVRRLIAEWQSPDFHDPATLAVFVVPVAITVAYLAFSRRDVPALELVMASFLLVSSLDAVRFIPYFAIAWCALAASCPPIEHETLRPSLIVWPLVAVLGVSLIHGPFYPAAQPASSVPVKAVAYLDGHPGRVFSTYLWNDYLDWVGDRSSSTAAPSSTRTTGCCRSTWRSPISPPTPIRSCGPMTWSTCCGSRERPWRSSWRMTPVGTRCGIRARRWSSALRARKRLSPELRAEPLLVPIVSMRSRCAISSGC